MREIRRLSKLSSVRVSTTIVSSLTVLVVLSLTSIGCKSGNSSDRKASELRTEIAKELAPNADYSEVIVFLDRNHIQHTPYAEARDDKELLGFLGAPGRIDGVIKDVQRGLISRSDIRLVFLFDEKGRMRSYEVTVSVTT